MQHQDSYIVVKEFTDNGKKTREVIATGVTKQGFIDAYTEKGCVMRGGENPHFEDIYSGIVYKLEKEFEQGGQIDRERDIQIAKTILMQMGGLNRLQMFTGAYNFVAVPYGVSFRIKNRKVNYVKIVLNAMDTYDVEFGLIRGANYKVVKELNGIYNDQLVEVFTRYTGMVLRLRKGGAIQGEENAEMVMNQNLQIRHHTEELEEILKSGKQVPAWVVSKLSRAADSISDATHYLEGTPDKMAMGGGVNKRGNRIITDLKDFDPNKTEIIDGDANFSKFPSITDLGVLLEIRGDAIFENSRVKYLGNLQTISGDADFGGSQVKSLGNLQTISGGAYFTDSQVQSLGNLQTIRGIANFNGSQVQDLGKLQTIGGFADFQNSQVQSLGNLHTIAAGSIWGERTDLQAEWENRQRNPNPMPEQDEINPEEIRAEIEALEQVLEVLEGEDRNLIQEEIEVLKLALGDNMAKGGGVRSVFSKAKSFGKRALDKSVKLGKSAKQKTQEAIRQSKKKIALDVLYDVKENLAEGRDEKIAVSDAFYVVDDRYAEGGGVRGNTQLSNEEIWSEIQALEEVLDVLEGADKNMVEISIKKLYLDLGESKDNNFLDLKIENKKEIIDFVKSNSYFDFEEGEEDEKIYFSTRENGDVGAEIASNIDIGEAKSLKKKVEDKFQDLVVTIEVVDEWVTLTIHKKQVDKYTYRYIFRKGVEGEGFTKGFENIYALIKYAKGFIDFVDWNEIIEKSNKITKYEEPQFTGWYWSSPILLKKAGEEGNKYGYNFYFIKSRGLKEEVNSYADGGGVRSFLSKAKSYGKTALDKSVKLGKSAKEKTQEAIRQSKKKIALDVLYDVKENLAEGRDEQIAVEKAFYVVDDRYAEGGGVRELPPKGELTNKDNFLLKYEKKGGDYEFYIYKPETKKVSGYNQVKHICVNSDCPHKMTYEQFVNYLYAELYLDDMKYANGGEIFVCPVGTEIQTLIFDKSMFNLRQAKAWAKKNNFENAYVDGKLNTLRIRQKDPNLFVEDGFRTIQLRQGVQAVIGCPKRKISRKK